MMIHFILISHYIILTYSFGAVHKVRYHITGANVLWCQMSSVLLSHISGSHVHFMSKSFCKVAIAYFMDNPLLHIIVYPVN